MTNSDDRWRFWLDVGGTFTDCVARAPDGTLHFHKTLSSGIVRGRIGLVFDSQTFGDTLRQNDVPHFWRNWEIRLIDSTGTVTATRHVVDSQPQNGQITVDRPWSPVPVAGQLYELTAHLESPLVAIRTMLGAPLNQSLPPLELRVGTTRGTNALLTRTGGRVAWLTTRGFGDILAIGTQARPKLFELTIRKRAPLYTCVMEIDERIAATGEVLVPLDERVVRGQLKELRASGVDSIAIGFLHAYAYPAHERQVAEWARAAGFRHLSLSSDLSSLMEIVARGETTVVNAYLQPVLDEYIESLESQLDPTSRAAVRWMTSAGSLTDRHHFQGKDSILSGPAGGVVGMAGVSQAIGIPRVLGFDMGGTSTDVSRYEGEFRYEYETEKAGIRIVTPVLAIETVAAGGGSLCGFDGIKLTVGPESAGASPGPASYGRGGPLTITDVNVYLDRLPLSAFPFPLDLAAVERRLQEWSETIAQTSGHDYSITELAHAYRQVADMQMAQAIRSISVAQGYDPREYALVGFGGAAPLHVCGVARELGIARVIDSPHASLLSALGIGLAPTSHWVERSLYADWNDVSSTLRDQWTAMEREAAQHLCVQGIDAAAIRYRHGVSLRYQGTERPLTIEGEPATDFPSRFAEHHRRLYGYTRPDLMIEVVAVRVCAMAESPNQLPPSRTNSTCQERVAERSPWKGNPVPGEVQQFFRNTLVAGDRIEGPARIVSPHTTLVVDEGWRCDVWTEGVLVLTDRGRTVAESIPQHCDPLWLEIFSRHFQQIAEEMGTTLRHTARSINVRQRLDFSCALFTPRGELVVNAPHVPVHLGAMGETVRSLLADHPHMQPGDVFLTNDPFHGGSHLPDLTVVTPVFDTDGSQLQWFVANRAHHAEIGGISPGSMPAQARTLADEGVLLRSFRIVAQGIHQFDRLAELLRTARYPSRDPSTNLIDVEAQIAANQYGVERLRSLDTRWGWEAIARYRQFLQEQTARKTRQVLARFQAGNYTFADSMDDGAAVRVRIELTGGLARFDFTGSATVQPNHLNANRAIVTSAVMYCLRCLIDEPIPLNEGVLEPVELCIPEGMLAPPARERADQCAAVSAGNVETSQRIVDVILGAWGVAAASQGTMNNLLFGDATFGYYETICGGAGATPQGPGADAVHTHMTNTRLTDPEVFEQRYPVRLRRFAIRHGSGGRGAWRGGNGVIREIEFLRPVTVTLVTQRRGSAAPFGLEGGEPGAPGLNQWIRRGDGALAPELITLSSRVEFAAQAGDIVIVATPGGGGYGRPT